MGEGENIPSLPHFYVLITNKDYSQVKDMFCFLETIVLPTLFIDFVYHYHPFILFVLPKSH